MFLGLEYYMEKLEVINTDSTKAFIRDERVGKELCMLVGPCRISLGGLSWWVDDILSTKDQFLEQFSPLKLNDVVCLAGEWVTSKTLSELLKDAQWQKEDNKGIRTSSSKICDLIYQVIVHLINQQTQIRELRERNDR
jgi:hypothetical protein